MSCNLKALNHIPDSAFLPVSSSYKVGFFYDFSLTGYLGDVANTSLVEMNKIHQDFFLLLAAGYFSILLFFKNRDHPSILTL